MFLEAHAYSGMRYMYTLYLENVNYNLSYVKSDLKMHTYSKYLYTLLHNFTCTLGSCHFDGFEIYFIHVYMYVIKTMSIEHEDMLNAINIS